MEQLQIDPGPLKQFDSPCRVCGGAGEIRCYGMVCCIDCRKFVHDQKKKSIPGWCSNNLTCFIGGTRQGVWDSSSGCQACRHDRIEYLGLIDLTLMKQRNMPRSLPNSVVSNVTGPSLPAFKKTQVPPVQAVPSTSSTSTSNSTSPPSAKDCRICHDSGPKNAKHYGVQSCPTCANFFLRSWRLVNKVPLQCQMQGPAEGQCCLRPSRTGAPPCRYCRLKKCIELKMRHGDQPFVAGSALEEMIRIMKHGKDQEPDDRVDGPSYDPDAPLFADQLVKEEAVDNDGDALPGGINAMELFMGPTSPVAPPPSVCFSPREIKHEAEGIINQTTGEIMFPEAMAEFFIPNAVIPPSSESSPALCPVCSTVPARKSVFGVKSCLPCQLFFTASAKADGTFKASCPSKNCDIRGDPMRCSVCRLLRCLQIGMTHKSGNIVIGSPIHRLLFMAKSWKLFFDIPPRQDLPRFLEENEPGPHLELSVCDVGKRHCERLLDVGQGIRSCNKCEAFFKSCLEEDQLEKPQLCPTGYCSTPCNKTECRPCRLRRCLEVGMTAPWRKDNSLYSVFLSEWQLTDGEDSDEPISCKCGRFIENGLFSDKCSTCMADSLLQLVQTSSETPKETNVQRLTREGLAIQHSESVGDNSSSSGGSKKRKASSDGGGSEWAPKSRKISKITCGTRMDQMAECQVCMMSFVFKQKNYGMVVCLSCSGFLHRSFTEEGDPICFRKKGDDPCSLQRVVQKDLDTRRNVVCSRCRLLKWVSLGPRLPFYPVPLTPLAQLVEQEQVAVLVPDEVRRGYFRVDPIDDNMEMAANKFFQLVMPGERPSYESDEGPSDSMDSTEVAKEITGAITRALERNKENEGEDDRDSPGFWRQRDVTAPCAVCGTVRRRRMKRLGAPACERCVTFIQTCWEKRTEETAINCKKHEGRVGRCPRSWRFKLCVRCQLERAVAVGCVCPGKPVPSSLADLIIRDQLPADGNGMDQDENCDTETEGASPSPSVIQQGENAPREAPEKDEACVGCAATYTSIRYNVRMCTPCHSFLRNNMKPSSSFNYCQWRDKKMGECTMELNPEVNRGCWYCRLKRLLSAGVRLCSENIAGSAVSVMISMEKINVEYVSGGSYAKKNTVMRVHKEKCQVCPNSPAASFFHGVYLCKNCRSFIVHQWSNPNMLTCANPKDPSKCPNLVAQKCGLCRLVKCISVGVRNNHLPHSLSFINKLCPGYPLQRNIDEAVLTAAMDRSLKLSRATSTKVPSSTSGTNSLGSSACLEAGGASEGRILQEHTAQRPSAIQLEHKFDTQKTVVDKVADFWSHFATLLSPIDTTNRKDAIEDQGFIKGWRACMFGLEPLFTAYMKWADSLFWLNEMGKFAKNLVVRDASAEAAVLIVAQILRVNGFLPYGKDKILRLADLTALLCEKQHKIELEVTRNVLECVALLNQLKFNGRDLGLLLNILLVTKGRFRESVVEEYYLELEDYLSCQVLDEDINWDTLSTLMKTINATGVLFRSGFRLFMLRRSLCSSLLNLPPLTKIFFNCP